MGHEEHRPTRRIHSRLAVLIGIASRGRVAAPPPFGLGMPPLACARRGATHDLDPGERYPRSGGHLRERRRPRRFVQVEEYSPPRGGNQGMARGDAAPVREPSHPARSALHAPWGSRDSIDCLLRGRVRNWARCCFAPGVERLSLRLWRISPPRSGAAPAHRPLRHLKASPPAGAGYHSTLRRRWWARTRPRGVAAAWHPGRRAVQRAALIMGGGAPRRGRGG